MTPNIKISVRKCHRLNLHAPAENASVCLRHERGPFKRHSTQTAHIPLYAMRQDFSGVGNTTTLINATRDLALVSPSPPP